MANKQAPKTCHRCGHELPDESKRLFSSWTRRYYCSDVDACARRARRNPQPQEVIPPNRPTKAACWACWYDLTGETPTASHRHTGRGFLCAG